jgi:signal transduction histidine kinase
MEIKGFESIANGIGISIANYRNFHASAGILTRFQQASTTITAVEVAQASRHEAIGLIDDCRLGLALLVQKLGKQGSHVTAELDRFDSSLKAVRGALDKIKLATQPPARDLVVTTLAAVWEQARSQIQGKLMTQSVRCVYEGPPQVVEIYEDWFRQVFLNLMLNSTDAFAESGIQRGRKISLSVSQPLERSQDIVMTYTDNATGINRSKLQGVSDDLADRPIGQLIFEPNVTSKPSGSGWGLYLVRKVLQDHKGSIDLLDHQKGVTFRITLPRSTKPRKPAGSMK